MAVTISGTGLDASTLNSGSVTQDKIANSAITIDKIAASVLLAIYPVGSVYINAANINDPATLLGFGTWVEVGSGRVLVGLNASETEFDTIGKTGGSKDSAIINHTHSYRDRYHAENSNTIVYATYKETTPTGYNGKTGTSGTDTDNNTWLYYDSTTGNPEGGVSDTGTELTYNRILLLKCGEEPLK